MGTRWPLSDSIDPAKDFLDVQHFFQRPKKCFQMFKTCKIRIRVQGHDKFGSESSGALWLHLLMKRFIRSNEITYFLM